MKFRVFPVDSDYLAEFGDEETICSVLDADEPDIYWEIFLNEDDTVKYTLYFSKQAYYSREEVPVNQCFENYLRDKVPYAPKFRGPMVLLDLEERDFSEFVEACQQKWEGKPDPVPAEDIPDGLLKTFNQIREPQQSEDTDRMPQLMASKK